MNHQDTKEQGHFGDAYSLKSGTETLTHYRSWAETYDKEVGEENGYAQPGRTAAMLFRFRPDPATVILDAGCGSGLSGLALRARGYQTVDGCDFSPEMLAKCAEKNCYRSLFAADLNIGQPTIEDASYDAVTCVGVFSFGHVLPEACDDLLRLVRPDGFLIIAVNEKFWDEGSLARKVELLEMDGLVTVEAKEYGDHLPGHKVNGWVIALRKS